MSEPGYPTSFVRHKVAVSLRLAAGECGGSYGDAILIVSSAVSALAADLYPGTGIDRKRFAEVWNQYADPVLKPVRISVPLLAQCLHTSNDLTNLASLRNMRPNVIYLAPVMVDSSVLDAEISDSTESDVRAACPTLAAKELRKFSYPNLFYSEIRSGFVHEGDTTSSGSSHPQPGGSGTADISYVNRIDAPYRRIHFSVKWLGRVAESIASGTATAIYQPRQPVPRVWWLDGA